MVTISGGTMRISSYKRALLVLADVRINTTRGRWRDSLLTYLAHDWNRQKSGEALLGGGNCGFYVVCSAMKEKQSHVKEYINSNSSAHAEKADSIVANCDMPFKAHRHADQK
jgi:hypothetical protein